MPPNKRPDETQQEYLARCRVYSREYYQKNKEKMQAYQRKYNLEHKDKKSSFSPPSALTRYIYDLLVFYVRENKLKPQPCRVCGSRYSSMTFLFKPGNSVDKQEDVKYVFLCDNCQPKNLSTGNENQTLIPLDTLSSI